MHQADVPAVLVQRGGGSEITEISADEPIPTPRPSPAVDDEAAPAVEYESDDTSQKRKRTSTTKCLQGFSPSICISCAYTDVE